MPEGVRERARSRKVKEVAMNCALSECPFEFPVCIPGSLEGHSVHGIDSGIKDSNPNVKAVIDVATVVG